MARLVKRTPSHKLAKGEEPGRLLLVRRCGETSRGAGPVSEYPDLLDAVRRVLRILTEPLSAAGPSRCRFAVTQRVCPPTAAALRPQSARAAANVACASPLTKADA